MQCVGGLSILTGRLGHLTSECISFFRGNPTHARETVAIDDALAILNVSKDSREHFFSLIKIRKILERTQFRDAHQSLYFVILDQVAHREDLDPQSRCAALGAFSKFGSYYVEVTFAFASALKSQDRSVRLFAIEGLKTCPNYDFVVKSLTPLCSSSDSATQRAACTLFKIRSGEEVVRSIAEILDHNNYYYSNYYSPRSDYYYSTRVGQGFRITR